MKEGKKSPIANRRPGYPETFKTLRQWNLLGYVPKDGCKGDACWTKAFCDWWSVYYYKDEVRLAQGDELAEFNAKEAERKAHKNEMSRRWHKKKRDLLRLEKAAKSSEIINCVVKPTALAVGYKTRPSMFTQVIEMDNSFLLYLLISA